MTIKFEAPVPILRIFSVEKAMEFYRDYLGFSVDWEHRFGENFPLYCQISRDGLKFHLSEHHGDASPGSNCYVYMTGVEELRNELRAKDYMYLKPDVQTMEWGLKELQVTDPFGNRIRFGEPVKTEVVKAEPIKTEAVGTGG